jgi:hypothetical protein
MTISEVSAEYDRQCKRHREEYAAWTARTEQQREAYHEEHRRTKQHTIPYPHYDGFHVDYAQISTMILQALQDEYGLTAKQAGLVHGKAYEDKHSCVGDMISYAGELAEFAKQFAAL